MKERAIVSYVCKVKTNWLKGEMLKKLGYDLYFPEGEEGLSDAEAYWAKTLRVPADSPVAGWLRHTLERIWQGGNCDETAKGEIVSSGYEFEEDGGIIDNERFLSDLVCQLCVAVRGEGRGELFINMGGIEFSDYGTLEKTFPEELDLLAKANAAYRKLMRK